MPTLDEFQSPSSNKLTPRDLAGIRRADEQWRDRIISLKPIVVDVIGEAAWGDVLAAALEPGALERWLCSLAPQISTATPCNISTVAPPEISTVLPPGVFRKGKRFVARVRRGQTIIFRRTCSTVEEATAALVEYRGAA